MQKKNYHFQLKMVFIIVLIVIHQMHLMHYDAPLILPFKYIIYFFFFIHLFYGALNNKVAKTRKVDLDVLSLIFIILV